MVMNPPSGGPITGPTSAGTVTQAIALTSALLSIERSSTSRPTGVIIAPPMPCTIRAMTKSVTEAERAQPIEPSMKTAIAMTEHHAGAEAVGGPSARRNEYRKRQQIRGNRELQRQRAGADIRCDRRKRCRNNRGIHVLHEQGSGHDERDQAFFFHRIRGEAGAAEAGLYHPVAPQAIAEPAEPPKS